MRVEAQINIEAPRAAVWAAAADIENSANIVTGIEKIEIVEKPVAGLAGLRWRETRILFGKPATVEKWVTEAAENEFYQTRAESDGFVFLTTIRLSGSDGNVQLVSRHDSQAQSVGAWFMSIPLRLFFRGVLRKAILKDLADIQSAVAGSALD
ncbi:SRPBCC family protein [Massilia endophytica]|uniref:SRPBCC family protein n=1 Tax=Massilia endophytica TaxID=2899220 RepID=UPI001E2AAFD6|nr:SRPBCC family protein [Massilia endophytica]UGQ48233.1 SRPBCC family protein [Massilia endophytica]